VTGELNSCIYEGRVVHNRTRPKQHALQYRVFSMLLDLNELPRLHQNLRGFSYNTFGLLSFHDRDHGAGDGTPLRAWVEDKLKVAGIDLRGGSIRLLCYPRILGYVFNPLSVYFCYTKSSTGEDLAAILYQVTNTFHERHSYLIPTDKNCAKAGSFIEQSCKKEMYVSPFIEMDMTYHFRIKPPDGAISIAIDETDGEGQLLYAAFNGTQHGLTRSAALKLFFKYPLMTLKVIGGIHWEALRLWMKGIPLVHHPAPPPNPVTVVKDRKEIAA
jgi:DUF1365 family protein